MRSRRLSRCPLSQKAAVIGDANPTLNHDAFRPEDETAIAVWVGEVVPESS